MGDDFVTYGFPFIDVESGGSINGMIDAVERVIAQLPPDVKVIPGHGPISSLDDMRGDFVNQDAFLETLYNSLTGQKNGKFIKHN